MLDFKAKMHQIRALSRTLIDGFNGPSSKVRRGGDISRTRGEGKVIAPPF